MPTAPERSTRCWRREIQYAMDYWRANDSTQREEGSPYQLMASTYLSSHPRASTREAALEAFRGKLKTASDPLRRRADAHSSQHRARRSDRAA